MSDYPECLTCHRPMRPARSFPSDHPGTVRNHASGFCDQCYRRAYKERRREAGIPEPERTGEHVKQHRCIRCGIAVWEPRVACKDCQAVEPDLCREWLAS